MRNVNYREYYVQRLFELLELTALAESKGKTELASYFRRAAEIAALHLIGGGR